jgi:hypothetical protein
VKIVELGESRHHQSDGTIRQVGVPVVATTFRSHKRALRSAPRYFVATPSCVQVSNH